MNNVQMRIREIEQKDRDNKTKLEMHNRKIGDIFWQQQQAQRYPNISENLLSNLPDVETLAIDNTDNSINLLDDFRTKLMTMTF